MVCHALQLLCARSVEVMSSSHFSFLSFVIMSVSLSPVSRVSSSNGFLDYCFRYASYRLFDSSVRPGVLLVLHALGICLLDATRTHYMNFP